MSAAAAVCVVPPGSGGSSNPPGRGGPWWNDPTYWIGLLLGVGLAYPLINRFILNGTSDKEKVCMSLSPVGVLFPEARHLFVPM